MSSAAEAQLAFDLASAGVRGDGGEGCLRRYAEGLIGLGVPLTRGYVALQSLHPLLRARAFLWRREVPDTELVAYRRNRAAPDDPDTWRSSPLYPLYASDASLLRYRLEQGEGLDRFDLLRGLAAAGVTEYLVLKSGFNDRGAGEGIMSAWATDQKGGFDDAQLACLRRTLPALELAIKAGALSWSAETLLTTYLGRDVALRVLDGDVERGVAQPFDAVIWASDLSGFTRLADAAPRDEVIGLLNAYAEATVDTIEALGGQVLKFMGDGILATFAMDGDAPARALRAAETALDQTRKLTRTRLAAGQRTTQLRLALHRGEVFYGNVGSTQRLDFTVIGPAVNETARLSDMCRALEQDLIVSAAFHDVAAGDHHRLVGLGRYALKGVAKAQALFTLERVG